MRTLASPLIPLLFGLLFVFNLAAQNVEFEWVRTTQLGSQVERIHSVTTDQDGNVYGIGVFEGSVDFDPGVGVQNYTAVGNYDSFIWKLDSAGNLEWYYPIGDWNQEFSWNIRVDDTANVIVTGGFVDTVDFDNGPGTAILQGQGNYDAYLMKLDSAGNFLWATSWGGSQADHGYALAVEANGRIHVTGTFRDSIDLDPGMDTLNAFCNISSNFGGCVFVSHFNSQGEFLGGFTYDGTEQATPEDIIVDDSGYVYVGGQFYGSNDFQPGVDSFALTSEGFADCFITKHAPDDSLLWAVSWGSDQDNDVLVGLGLASDGALISTGLFGGTVDFDPDTNSFDLTSNGNSDIFLSKVDKDGLFEWAVAWGGPFIDGGRDLVLDEEDNIYSTGYFRSQVDFDPDTNNSFIVNAGSSSDVYVTKHDPSGDLLWLKNFGGNDDLFSFEVALDPFGRVITGGNFEGTTDFDPLQGVESIASVSGSDDAFIHVMTPCTYFNYDTIDVTVCDSLVTNHGSVYTTSGFYLIDTISNFLYCDTIYYGNVTVNYSVFVTDTQVACDSLTWLDGITYDSNNTTAIYIDTAANGCDSVITLHLTILQSDSTIDSIVACDSYTWIDSVTYTSSTSSPTFTLTNQVGCDSVVTLHLTILESVSTVDVQEACDSFTWVDGTTYTSSNNTATYVTTAANGCDSVVTLDLTIYESAATTDVIEACGFYTWVDGNTYSQNNSTAQFLTTTVNGCDSIVTLDLTFTPLDLGVTVDTFVQLTANQEDAMYQWLECDSMGVTQVLAGETGQSFTPSYSGQFMVEVSKSNCIDTSSCISFTMLGLDPEATIDAVTVFPNPTSSALNIQSTQQFTSWRLRTVDGRTVGQGDAPQRNEWQIDLSTLTPGNYLLSLEGPQAVVHRRVVKM